MKIELKITSLFDFYYNNYFLSLEQQTTGRCTTENKHAINLGVCLQTTLDILLDVVVKRSNIREEELVIERDRINRIKFK